jgi:cell division septation protein DedD
MSFRRLLLIACSAAALSTGPGVAQSLRNLPVPAEFPPASYTGTQYVDSAGCVFIRAGVGDNVTWVPRLTRSRQPLCGFAPSLAGASPQPAPAQQTQRATAAQRTAPAPRRAEARPEPASARPAARTPERVTVITIPGPAPRSAAASATAAPRPAPKPAAAPIRTTTATTTTTARRIVPPDPGRTACAGLSGVSAAYTVQHNGSPVRCGPQAAHYITYAHGGGARGAATAPPPGTRATPDTVPPGTRVAPARVYASQKASLAGIRVPQGMKPVWEDDRLNPRRAHQTFEGKARMELMWTNTVPRRLIDRRSGAEVIHNYPGLQPPFTSFEAQRAAGVTVATRGTYVPDPLTVTDARRRAQATAPRASVSTRSAPPAAAQQTAPAPTPRQAAHYAQAGLFADAAQGLAAAQRIAGAGLPARRGTLHRDGGAMTLVLAGPFASEAEARDGAARLRAMGFAEVRLR